MGAVKRSVVVLLGIVALLVTVAAGGAAACAFTSLKCGIRASPEDAGSTGLADGFSQVVLASGLEQPTDVVVVPDGRILVAERTGLVRVIDRSGRLAPRPLLDLGPRMNTAYTRGLMAIQIDPRFAANGFIYALYVREDHSGKPDAPRTMRLSRFTVTGDRAPLSSERVLLGKDGRGTCLDLPRTSDCLPSNIDHNGGDIQFARDGSMYVATGEGGGLERTEPVALTAQDVDALGGKVLRITRRGNGLPDNPFWNGDPHANRSKVWGLGLRNPFRMALRPGSDVPYVGDVGWRRFEELDSVPRGSNNGWPCYEGFRRQPDYAKFPVCRRLYRRHPGGVHEPSVAYGRNVGGTVILGDFLTAPSDPPELRGGLVYGDFGGAWLRVLRLDAAGRPIGKPAELASNTAGPVGVLTERDGSLLYLSYNRGELRRIQRGT